MATATSSAFTLQEETGRSYVTLTSYAGPITWTTTPVSGDIIEYPDNVVVGADGSISGSAGTYTIRHIVAATGAIQSVSYTLTSGNTASAVVDLDTDTGDGFDYVTLTGYAGQMTWATTPVAGDQIMYPSNVSVSTTGVFSGANATYTLYHVIASTGAVQALSYTHSGSNTAPTFGSIPDVVANQTDTASFSIAATDPDVGDTLTYSHDVLPNGITRTGATVSGTYNNEETVLTTFTVQDDSGDTGNDSDTAQVLFSIARAGYTITTLTVNYAGLNPDSNLIEAITDQDLEVGDQVDYPETATDAVGNVRAISYSTDGLMTAEGTRSIKVDNIYFRDKSDGFSRKGPQSATFKGTGPELTSPLEVVPNSQTSSGGQMRFTSDEGSEVVGANGDYRLIAIPSGFGTPTRAQVMSGNGPDGNPATFDSGLQQQAATVEEIVTVTGLPTAGAGYWIFLALEDQYGGVTLVGPVTLTTLASGTPPVWQTVPNQSFTQGSEVSFDIGQYCSDFVTISISGLDDNTALTLNPTTWFLEGTPDLNDASGAPGSTTNYTVTLTANNATAPSVTTFVASFYRLNLPVNTGSIPDQSWQENVNVSLALNNYITGATSYELQIDGVDATNELDTYNLTFNAQNGTVTGTPNALSVTNSPYSMRARGVNDDGPGDWINFTATSSASSPPVFTSPIPNQTITEGVEVSIDVSGNVSGATSYTLIGLPSGSVLQINNSGLITGLPNSSDVNNSPYNLTVRAFNADGYEDGVVQITANAASVPTLIAGFPDLSFAVGSTVSVTFANYIRNATSYVVTGLPDNTGLIPTATGISGVFTQDDSDSAPFNITVQGIKDGDSVSDTFQISSLTQTPYISITDPAALFVKFFGNRYKNRTQAGSDNWSQIQLYNSGLAYILNNLTDLECILSDGTNTYTLSRSSNSSSFELIPDEGKFNVRLGESGAPAGRYYLDVKYYDLQNSDGVLFTAYKNLILEVA